MELALKDLAVRFGTVRALGGVSLELTPGQVSVLAGPNGAGKSTMMSVLLGLVRPNAGEVLYNGHLVAGVGRVASLEFRERLGYMPESAAFSDGLTGREILGFFASARGVSASRVEATLETVGLAHAAHRRVGGYSRGMRQRLGLAVAILHTPDVLVLDEPTGGLDQQGLQVLWRVLEEWRRSGRIVLLSTHELALIERRADRLFVLVDGTLRAHGTPDELRAQSGLEEVVRVGPALDEVYEALIGGGPWAASHVH